MKLFIVMIIRIIVLGFIISLAAAEVMGLIWVGRLIFG